MSLLKRQVMLIQSNKYSFLIKIIYIIYIIYIIFINIKIIIGKFIYNQEAYASLILFMDSIFNNKDFY